MTSFPKKKRLIVHFHREMYDQLMVFFVATADSTHTNSDFDTQTTQKALTLEYSLLSSLASLNKSRC